MRGWITRSSRSIDLADLALVVGLVLLWIGLSMVAPALPFIVVGILAIAYGLLPIVLTATRRAR